MSMSTLVSGFALVALIGMAQIATAEEHSTHLKQCAKTCADCQIVCDACYSHCLDLIDLAAFPTNDDELVRRKVFAEPAQLFRFAKCFGQPVFDLVDVALNRFAGAVEHARGHRDRKQQDESAPTVEECRLEAYFASAHQLSTPFTRASV